MEFCLVTNMTLCLCFYSVLRWVLLSLWLYNVSIHSHTFSLNFLSHSTSIFVTFYRFFPCIDGSSFLCLSAPWSRLSSLPGYLMYYFSLQGLRVEMKYGGQASTGMLIFCVITSGWGPGLGSVSINLRLSLAPAAFWNPTLPTHRGETLTHDLSHRQGCWEWPVTLRWALSESAQSDPSEPHDLPSHSCAWSVLRGRKGTRQMGVFGASLCCCACVCWCVRMGVRCVCVTVFVYVSVYAQISSPLPPARTLTGECIHRDRWVTKTACLLQPGPWHVDRVRQSINHPYKGHGPLMVVCL